MDLGETFKLLSPELILLLTGLVVLVVDLAWQDEASGEASDEASSQGKKTIWIPAIALVGLGLALVATLLLWGEPPTTVLAMMAVDPFALFFKILTAKAQLDVLDIT